jgi:hypothetical protein
MDVNPKTGHIVIGHRDGTVTVLSAMSGQILLTFQAHKHQVTREKKTLYILSD